MVDYSQDAAVGALTTLADLTKERSKLRKQITSLQKDLYKHRFSSYSVRKNILKRIRDTERSMHAVLAEITNLTHNAKYDLYQAQEAKVKGGLSVKVEISIDGDAYSNPAPAIPPGAHVWLKAVIDEAHEGTAGVPKQHELCHVTWVYHKGYVPLDTIKANGRDEYFVSYPLVLIREFIAPGANTKRNFFVYVDAYERID